MESDSDSSAIVDFKAPQPVLSPIESRPSVYFVILTYRLGKMQKGAYSESIRMNVERGKE
jgi:hypothetical protein